VKVGSLFSGIGGFDLGLERAGFESAWFCEADPYATRVLRKHWPELPVFPDVRELTAEWAEPIDVLCGGFPCQDLSVAGAGAGVEGARSGLWSEFARLIGEFRPRYVLVENVAALLARGAGRVLGDLAALGYDAEWDCIPASAIGAPHQRDRIWIVAYPNGGALWDEPGRSSRPDGTGATQPGDDGAEGSVADADRGGEPQQRGALAEGGGRPEHGGQAEDVEDAAGEGRRQAGGGERDDAGRAGAFVRSQRAGEVAGEVADPERERLEGLGPIARESEVAESGDGSSSSPYANRVRCDRGAGPLEHIYRSAELANGGWWLVEPDVGRVAHGVPSRLDRVRCLGNALVPQIAEFLGRRIMAYEEGAGS
jgi:DNA (cytosine-5)-methyltransferase 1